MSMTPDESKAVALYAILARDPCDFVDMVREEDTSDGCLETMYAMFVTPNPRSDSELRAGPP